MRTLLLEEVAHSSTSLRATQLRPSKSHRTPPAFLPDATARWERVVVVAVPGRAMRRERNQQDARTAGGIDGVEGVEEVV